MKYPRNVLKHSETVGNDEVLQIYKDEYEIMIAAGVEIEDTDLTMLGQLAISMYEIEELTLDIHVNGRILESMSDRGSPQFKPNPSVATLQKEKSYMMSIAKEFGRTPQSRKLDLKMRAQAKSALDEEFDNF